MRPSAVPDEKPARRGAVVAGLAHPVDLRHAESVRVQPARRSSPTAKPPVPPHRRRCRTAPASTARRGRRPPAPAPALPGFAWAQGCRRSRCPPVVRADGRHRCPRADGRARRRRRCRRPPGHAAARSLEAVLVARPRPTMSRHPPALPTPAGHRRGRDRPYRHRTAAASRRRAPMTPAPPAVPPRPRSRAIRGGWRGAGARVPARRRPPRRPPPPLATGPTEPAGRRRRSRQHTLADRWTRLPRRSARMTRRPRNGL